MRINFCNSILVLAPILCLLGCDSKSPVQMADDIGTVTSAVSDCGGFAASTKRAGEDIPFELDPKTYNDSERLLWRYERETSVLSIMDARVMLNCCGDRTITASQENGALIIAENDQPEGGTGRCRCICSFDFFIELSGISPRVVPLKLILAVDDSTWTKWQGDIDITGGNGDILIPGANQAEQKYRW